jgi:hypothetical protein
MQGAASHLHVPRFGDQRTENEPLAPFGGLTEALASQPRASDTT